MNYDFTYYKPLQRIALNYFKLIFNLLKNLNNILKTILIQISKKTIPLNTKYTDNIDIAIHFKSRPYMYNGSYKYIKFQFFFILCILMICANKKKSLDKIQRSRLLAIMILFFLYRFKIL